MEEKSEFVPEIGYGVDLDTQIFKDAEKLAQAVRDGIVTSQQIEDREVPDDVLYSQIGITKGHSGFSFGAVSNFALVMLAVGSPCPFCGTVIESFEHAYNEFPIWVGDENFSLAHRDCYEKSRQVATDKE